MARTTSLNLSQHNIQPRLSRRTSEQTYPYPERHRVPQPCRRSQTEFQSLSIRVHCGACGVGEYCIESVEGPRSPESVRSKDSHDYASSVAQSFVTGTTVDLERQRQISPVVATPTSSNSSVVYINQSQEHYQTASNPRKRHFRNPYYSQNTYRRPVSPQPESAALAGVGAQQSLSPIQDINYNAVEFLDPHGPAPGRHQRSPHSGATWTGGYPFRHQEPMLLDTDTPQQITILPSSQSPSDTGERTGGRRKGPLTTEGRINANKVRHAGACLRCTYMKETCGDEDPCKNCSNKKARKWKCGCRRKPLDKYIQYLIPPILADKLGKGDVIKYISNSMMWYTDSPDFLLQLDIGFRKNLVLPVKEIEPNGMTQYQRKAYITTISDHHSESVPVCLDSPPLTLYLRDWTHDLDRIRKQIRVLAEEIMGNADTLWPWHCFPETPQKEEDWLGHILVLIHQYYSPGLQGHEVLQSALFLPFFNYILSHPFEIPQSQLHDVYQNIRHESYHGHVPTGRVCPDTINRYIKALVLPMTKEIATKALTSLHDLLHKIATNRIVNTANTDLAFCLAFILLLFLGRTQYSVLVQGLTSDEPDKSSAVEEARRIIQEMESELGDYIVHFHAYAYSRRKATGSSSYEPADPASDHASAFGLMDQIKDICKNYGPDMSDCEFVSFDEKTFDFTNTSRLCSKFIKAIFEN